jgi:hypothetical protein
VESSNALQLGITVKKRHRHSITISLNMSPMSARTAMVVPIKLEVAVGQLESNRYRLSKFVFLQRPSIPHTAQWVLLTKHLVCFLDLPPRSFRTPKVTNSAGSDFGSNT